MKPAMTTERINFNVPRPALRAIPSRYSPTGFNCGRTCESALRKLVEANSQKAWICCPTMGQSFTDSGGGGIKMSPASNPAITLLMGSNTPTPTQVAGPMMRNSPATAISAAATPRLLPSRLESFSKMG